MRKLNGIVLSALFGAISFSGGVNAQSAPVFNDQNLTKENLIDALKPEGAPPKSAPAVSVKPGSRGIVISDEKTDPKLECAYYRKKNSGSRGIQIAENAGKKIALYLTFTYNSAELTPESKKALGKLGDALQSETLNQCCFRVEGHTDAQGADEYNQKLSKRRADSVASYLEKAFHVDKDRLDAVGYGETKPVSDNDTEEGRQKNRRVEITNLGYAQQASE